MKLGKKIVAGVASLFLLAGTAQDAEAGDADAALPDLVAGRPVDVDPLLGRAAFVDAVCATYDRARGSVGTARWAA